MTIELHHHPHSRAASVVWMLEEVGCDYVLRHVDLKKGEQKSPEVLALNPMGKLPILVDGDTVVTETAAVGLYLADRYAPGRLAPALDAPERGAYLRWSVFAPSVIEPASMAQAAEWKVNPGSAGFGTYAAMLSAVEAAVGEGPWILGDTFSMADVIFGGTVRFMLRFGMLEARPSVVAYTERLSARPAALAADARNAESAREHGLA